MNPSMPAQRSRRQWEATAKARVSKGEPGTGVEASFVNEGLDAPTAKAIVDAAVTKARTRAFALLGIGGAFAFLDLIVTIVSYAETRSSYGSTYFVWYGPIICGIIGAIIGLVKLLSIRR